MNEDIKSCEREKRSAVIVVACKPSEKRMWLARYGDGDLSRKVRELLNKACTPPKKGKGR